MKTADMEGPAADVTPDSGRLRVVAWNCLQGLEREATQLLNLDPDIAVIAECRDVGVLGEGRLRSVGWTGRNPYKGLGIFARAPVSAVVNPAWDPSREWFLPVHVESAGIDVIGVWAMNHRGAESGPKRGRTLRALQHYEDILVHGRSIVIGDFNNNTGWDTARHPEFRTLVDWLGERGYVSVYHALNHEEYGKEKGASLYWQHRKEQPYLVDYVFVPDRWLPLISRFALGDPDHWLQWSDHVPIVLEVGLPQGPAAVGTLDHLGR